MENIIISFLNMTAWHMNVPKLFGTFHITALILTTALAVIAAVLFARSAESSRGVSGILTITGWVLVALEVYKQLFLYYMVNGGAFDFWFFPFQLCSVPMYLCILMPLFQWPARSTFMTFMGGYTFVSAVAALIYPEDMLRPFVSLTVHGFLWHGLLLFISLFLFLTGSVNASKLGIRNAAGLFAILSVIAIMINIVAEPVMRAIRAAHPAVAHDWAAMFYLNPFHISPQPVVSAVQRSAGIPAGLLLYAVVTALVSSAVVICFKRLAIRTFANDKDGEKI